MEESAAAVPPVNPEAYVLAGAAVMGSSMAPGDEAAGASCAEDPGTEAGSCDEAGSSRDAEPVGEPGPVSADTRDSAPVGPVGQCG